MDKPALKNYIKSIYPIAEEILPEILIDFEGVSVPKKTIYIKENKIINQSYFLEKGFVRSFVIDEKGNDVTTGLYSAPCFVYDFTTFFKQMPAQQNFETITDCDFWCMNIHNINKHFHKISEYREFGRLLFLNHFLLVEQLLLDMVRYSAEKRYSNLLTKHPDLIQNIPLNIIASYLGVTKNSLSRIRKEIFKKP